MCELRQFFPACVWTVMMGLNKKKESGVLSLLRPYKDSETGRIIYSLVQRGMQKCSLRMSDLSIKDQMA